MNYKGHACTIDTATQQRGLKVPKNETRVVWRASFLWPAGPGQKKPWPGRAGPGIGPDKNDWKRPQEIRCSHIFTRLCIPITNLHCCDEKIKIIFSFFAWEKIDWWICWNKKLSCIYCSISKLKKEKKHKAEVGIEFRTFRLGYQALYDHGHQDFVEI